MCNCFLVWNSITPPPPCPVHSRPQVVVLCACKQAPWLPACRHSVVVVS